MIRPMLLAGVIAIASVGAIADDEGRLFWRYIWCNEDAARELATRDPKEPAPSREVLALEAVAKCKTKEDVLAASYPADKLQQLRSWVQKSSEKWIECIQVEQRDCGPRAFSRASGAYRHCMWVAAREAVDRAHREKPYPLMAGEATAAVDVLAGEAMAMCKTEEDAVKASYSGEQPQDLRSWMQGLSEWAVAMEKRKQLHAWTVAKP